MPSSRIYRLGYSALTWAFCHRSSTRRYPSGAETRNAHVISECVLTRRPGSLATAAGTSTLAGASVAAIGKFSLNCGLRLGHTLGISQRADGASDVDTVEGDGVGVSWAVGDAGAAQPARSSPAKAMQAGAVYGEVIMGSLY